MSVDKVGISRRELVFRLCKAISVSFICNLDTNALAQSNTEAQELIRRVQWMGDHVAGQSQQVREWLQHSVIVAAVRSGTFHESFANRHQFQSATGLDLPTKVGFGHFGVGRDPWLAPAGYSQDVTLNNAEMASLVPGLYSLRNELRLSVENSDSLTLCPLAKGPRFPPADQYNSFARLVVESREDLDKFDLKYYRFFVIRAEDHLNKSKAFTPIIAYAYQVRGQQDLRISYASLQA